MKRSIYAAIAGCLAMLATTGVVALATAAPGQPSQPLQNRAEAELTAGLDQAIERQLYEVKTRLLGLGG